MVSERYRLNDTQKTREQLLNELVALRQRVAELEQAKPQQSSLLSTLSESEKPQLGDSKLDNSKPDHSKPDHSQTGSQQASDAQPIQQRGELNTWRVLLLQQLTASLAGALTKNEIFEVLLHQGLAALNATKGWVAQRVAADQIQIVKTIGYPNVETNAWRQVSLNEPMPVTDTIRTGKPIIVRSLQECYQQYPDLAMHMADMGEQSLVALPLSIGGQVIGSLGWSFAEPQEFEETDCSFMMTLARQCAQALERANLYEAERLARETAEAANRVKDEFLAVLSHELRSPLNPILGWTKMLRSRQFNPQMTERALDAIERNAKLQIQLIEDLLDVSHILQGKLRLNISIVNLVSVIEAALETMRLAAESKSIELKFLHSGSDSDSDSDSDCFLDSKKDALNTALDGSSKSADLSTDLSKVCVAGDCNRLQQIVWNLVSNAVKFTPAKGKVVVRLSVLSQPPVTETLPDNPNNQPTRYAQISISDTGRGIDPAFLPYIFEYFRQADGTITRQFGGLGLGLTIVRHLVELHGGSIYAESQGEGKGATFRVILPLLRKSMSSSSLPPKVVHPSLPRSLTKLLRRTRILFVDDDADMREYVECVLRDAGAQVALASSAGEALAKLSRFKPDVLISDIGMPNVDGYTLLKQIRTLVPELGGQVPAIALTAYAGEYNQQQILAAGFQLHIAKPVEPDNLVVAIANLLADQTQSKV